MCVMANAVLERSLSSVGAPGADSGFGVGIAAEHTDFTPSGESIAALDIRAAARALPRKLARCAPNRLTRHFVPSMKQELEVVQ